MNKYTEHLCEACLLCEIEFLLYVATKNKVTSSVLLFFSFLSFLVLPQ